jgi:hypothetical protein
LFWTKLHHGLIWSWNWTCFGISKKLVKYVVHLSKKKSWKKLFFFTQAAQTAIDQFLVSRNFRGQNWINLCQTWYLTTVPMSWIQTLACSMHLAIWPLEQNMWYEYISNMASLAMYYQTWYLTPKTTKVIFLKKIAQICHF